ncbi:hypothetical protein BTM25_19160 [Actinomadura rubteroloni]|uniref:Uncharacterized protein n=1 Tax=Actinomadura rubteroloni TaxID=1926885 RepID=A0A2P4UR30_9ACTN|nr:hypothetical protein [Actinomadura rubteroloni]POM27501.1 hypothetical protein BTM25_19160 [Actinomadura rubteroloni]
MRAGSVVLILWLVIGAFAAAQRHYFDDADKSCADFGTLTLTIVAGPLNYFGVNPKVHCETPQPSK